MISKIVAYPKASGFDLDEGPFETDRSGRMGGCGERVHGEGGICAD